MFYYVWKFFSLKGAFKLPTFTKKTHTHRITYRCTLCICLFLNAINIKLTHSFPLSFGKKKHFIPYCLTMSYTVYSVSARSSSLLKLCDIFKPKVQCFFMAAPCHQKSSSKCRASFYTHFPKIQPSDSPYSSESM